jgi:hypothetical protein
MPTPLSAMVILGLPPSQRNVIVTEEARPCLTALLIASCAIR